MFRDFIYLDIDRVQSIIAQLQEGLLEQIIEGKTDETSANMGFRASLLSLLIPIGFSASVGQKNAANLEQNKVLHDYAFDVALNSLREQDYLLEDDFSPMPETGFVLIKGLARILDYGTLRDIAAHWDDLNDLFDPPKNDKAKRERRKSEQSTVIRNFTVLIDTFFKDAIRVRVKDSRKNSFIDPLTREHLLEDIHSLIYKYGSNPKGEWTMLAEISRRPVAQTSFDELLEHIEEASRQTEENQQAEELGQFQEMLSHLEQQLEPQQPLSNIVDPLLDQLNALQELISSPSSPDVSVSPIAIYREIPPHS